MMENSKKKSIIIVLVILLLVCIVIGAFIFIKATNKDTKNRFEVFDMAITDFGSLVENGKILCVPTPLNVELFEETTEINSGDKIFVDNEK